MSRGALYCVLAVVLSGCAVSRPDEMTTGSLDRLVQPTAANLRDSQASVTEAKPHAVASLPPDAGTIKRVVQAMSANELRQEIIYDRALPGLPESAVDLRVRLSKAPLLDEPIMLVEPSEASIRSELKTQFPRMAMQIVETPRANGYGPYGLAIGRWDNGARCIYAWQWIDDIKTDHADAVAHPASVRIRLCRSGLTLDQMAGFVDRLQIDPVRTDEPAVQARATAPTPRHHFKRSEPRKVDSRPTVTTVVPTTVSMQQDTPLDPSLPTAAYRGPAVPSK